MPVRVGRISLAREARCFPTIRSTVSIRTVLKFDHYTTARALYLVDVCFDTCSQWNSGLSFDGFRVGQFVAGASCTRLCQKIW